MALHPLTTSKWRSYNGTDRKMSPLSISMLTMYMPTIGLDVISPERKRAILLHCLGAESLCIFQTLGEVHTYGRAVEFWMAFH